MEKTGFIYIWYDSRRKMYYIGCHLGEENDGYICSSNRMRDAYRRRPKDFKRRILKRNIIKTELLTEEHKWLSMILDEELGKKYYNLHKHHFGHWSNNEEMKRTIGQKISSSPYRAIRIGLANKGKKPAQKTLDANIQKLKGKSYEEIHGPEKAAIIKEKISNAGKGKKHNDAARKKMSEKAKQRNRRSMSEDTKLKISESLKKSYKNGKRKI